MSVKDLLNSIFVSAEEDKITSAPNQQVVSPDQETPDPILDEGGTQVAVSDKKNNVVKISNSQNLSNTIQIVVPRIYGEAERIGQQLLDGKGLIINFSRMPDTDARRFIDYLAGIVYAVDGDMQRVGTDIFLAVPNFIEIEGLFDEPGENSNKNLNANSKWQKKGQED